MRDETMKALIKSARDRARSNGKSMRKNLMWLVAERAEKNTRRERLSALDANDTSTLVDLQDTLNYTEGN